MDDQSNNSGRTRYTHRDAEIDEFKLRKIGAILPPIYRLYDASPRCIREAMKPVALMIQNKYFDMIIRYSDNIGTLIKQPVSFKVIQPGDLEKQLSQP